MDKNRVILLILDSLGIGELSDASDFGDKGANTFKSLCKDGDIKIPNLRRLGIGNIDGIDFLDNEKAPIGAYGKSKELSKGKDTTTGHWELMGIHTKEPFKTYPNSFPKELIKEIESKIGYETLGNEIASGTEIIKRLGQEHIDTKKPIIYTSADSVLQVAAHEEIIPIEELHNICAIIREIMVGEHSVARIIARPFIGEYPNFERTSNRKDLSISPSEKTALNIIIENNKKTLGIGKVGEIFNQEGISNSIKTKDNKDGIDKTIEAIKNSEEDLIFTNLVDFDSKYGHRRDSKGYKEALEYFDTRLDEITGNLKPNDILIITADHGNDPGFKGTDHTREYIPILVYGSKVRKGLNLGEREMFSDIGKTILDILDIKNDLMGNSFKSIVLED